MSLDLKLIPIECETGTVNFSHTLLSLNSHRSLFLDIAKLPSAPVPKPFRTYLSYDKRDGEPHYGNVHEDGYGKPLAWVVVLDLLRWANHPAVCDDYQNRAAWAYLACLPSETKIALYWC